MDDFSLKALLEGLPVFWWEADELGQVRERGGGAFADPGTAERFLDRMRREFTAPEHPPWEGHWQTRFDGRTFDVRRPLDECRPGGRTRGLAVEVDEGPEVPRRYAAFAGLVDLAPAAAFIRDRDGRYLWANHAYAHLYGTAPEELVGRYIEDFDTPADAGRFRALDQEILSRGTPVRHTLGYRRPDGSTGQAVGHRFPVGENRRFPALGKPGDPHVPHNAPNPHGPRSPAPAAEPEPEEDAWTCVAGIYVDVTEHLSATARRQEAEESLRALRDHSGLPCALLSVNGRVVEASTAAADLFRLRVPDLVGRRTHTLLAPDPGLGRLHRRWNDLIARRTRRVEMSAVLVDADGRQRRAQVHLAAVGRPGSRARNVWAVVTHQGLAHEAHPSLTAAQIRILSLLAEGSSNGDIATSLRLSRQTVD